MKIGIIGIGSMGSIIAKALEKNGYELILSDRGSKKDQFKDKDIQMTTNIDVAKNSDYLILAVKPYIYPKVIEEIKDYLDKQVIISIAAGQSLKGLEEMIGDKKIVMTMPNTPAQVFEAISAICPNKNLEQKEIDTVCDIFSSFGQYVILEEEDFASFSAAASALPAYVFMFIEAVADAAVLTGLKRDLAYQIISQAVKGSAQMVLETKEHPGYLKDMVTSPRGITIEGVKVLEEKNFRASLIDAINAAYEKSKNM